MFFIVNRNRLRAMIKVTHPNRRQQIAADEVNSGPFFRLEAANQHLQIRGPSVEAEFPATVYEEGVLFLKINFLRYLLDDMPAVKELAIQVNQDGMFIDNVRLSFAIGNMLLYPNPESAPAIHPSERPSTHEAIPEEPPAQGFLFDP